VFAVTLLPEKFTWHLDKDLRLSSGWKFKPKKLLSNSISSLKMEAICLSEMLLKFYRTKVKVEVLRRVEVCLRHS
jgi:hypothetical protein